MESPQLKNCYKHIKMQKFNNDHNVKINTFIINLIIYSFSIFLVLK